MHRGAGARLKLIDQGRSCPPMISKCTEECTEEDSSRTVQVNMSRLINRVRFPSRIRHDLVGLACLFLVLGPVLSGCGPSDPIVTYTIPTAVPDQLKPGKDRMLAAMVPHDDQVWFFKMTGPEAAIATVEDSFREFVREVQFDDGTPLLDPLPEGWRRGGDKPMRFATIDIDTPERQLNISVSKLSRQPDWDGQVKANVNRWRGQLGLDPSDDKWAEGAAFELASAKSEPPSIWVDLVGDPSEADDSMSSPPLARRNASVPPSSPVSSPPVSTEPDARLSFDQPEGWRPSRSGGMRMAAFKMGSEEAAAELTVIRAGGDLRGNVARWLGQVRGGSVADEVIDAAFDKAQTIEVDGRSGQRFLLTGEQPDQGMAIDGTIVPMEGGTSLFVKVTGPAATVTQQSDAIATFLKSLELNL